MSRCSSIVPRHCTARVEALATDTLGMVFEHLNARELARFSHAARGCVESVSKTVPRLLTRAECGRASTCALSRCGASPLAQLRAWEEDVLCEDFSPNGWEERWELLSTAGDARDRAAVVRDAAPDDATARWCLELVGGRAARHAAHGAWRSLARVVRPSVVCARVRFDAPVVAGGAAHAAPAPACLLYTSPSPRDS